MMANGWKSKLDILADYDLSNTSFERLRKACLASDYADAIVVVGEKCYVVEDRFQAFLSYMSEKARIAKNGAKTTRRVRKLHTAEG